MKAENENMERNQKKQSYPDTPDAMCKASVMPALRSYLEYIQITQFSSIRFHKTRRMPTNISSTNSTAIAECSSVSTVTHNAIVDRDADGRSAYIRSNSSKTAAAVPLSRYSVLGSAAIRNCLPRLDKRS
ncbi:hypothetical protein Lal_00034921 [Lupinus albus]|nr:hypothetical protein Lal_00034921 [Lupinus albus]